MSKQIGPLDHRPLQVPDSVSLDTAHWILAAEARRLLLEILEGADRSEPLSALAEEIGARSAHDREVERVHISLYHIHVPKMEEVGLVEYDDDSETVRLTRDGEALADGLAG